MAKELDAGRIERARLDKRRVSRKEETRRSMQEAFETDGIDTEDGKNKLMISILSAVAEMESQMKSDAIKAGIRWRMHEGIYRFSVVNALGYYRDYAGIVKIEPAEAEIVQYIYDRFLEGSSPQSIKR